MRFLILFLFLCIPLFSACDGRKYSVPADDTGQEDPNPDPPGEKQIQPSTISSLTFSGMDGDAPVLILTLGQSTALSLNALLSDGTTLEAITNRLQSAEAALDEPIIWFSNNAAVASVTSNGVVSALKAGRTNILVSVLNAG